MTVVVGGVGEVSDEEIGGGEGKSGGPGRSGRVVDAVDVGCNSVGECRGTGTDGRGRIQEQTDEGVQGPTGVDEEPSEKLLDLE